MAVSIDSDHPSQDDDSVLVSARDLADTYNSQSYESAWQAVEQYQRVIDYTADHPGKGSSAVANALDLPRSRIRSWVDADGRPDPVRGIETAHSHDWLPITTDSNRLDSWARATAWLLSSGSIDTTRHVPMFVADSTIEQNRLDSLLDHLDVSTRTVHADSDDRATEATPSEHASVLGRLMVCLGVHAGRKTSESDITLPAFLSDAPADARCAFAREYVHQRGCRDGERIRFREERPRQYLRSLADLLRDVTGEQVSRSGHNIILSSDAVDTLGL